jgi:hypothetical protein
MSVRTALSTLFLAALWVSACSGSPTQGDGKVSITLTTTTTTTTAIPQLTAGAIAASPSGTGVAAATVYTFQYASQPAGGVPPYTFAWKFGDGIDGAGATTSHAYASTGDFIVTGTATDTRGASASTTTTVSVRSVTGRWIAKAQGVALASEPIDILQTGASVTATVNSTNGFGLGTGSGTLANPRVLSITVTHATAVPPFAAAYVGTIDSTLSTWTGTVTGYAPCPCTFIATRASAPQTTASQAR